MGLMWHWDEKIGEVVTKQEVDGEVKEFTKDLYEGNAFLICINEWIDDDNKNMYSLNWFFVDKKHAEICLGLVDGKTNIFIDGSTTISKLRINKSVSHNWVDIVDLFTRAFDNIEIELYREEK